MNNLIPLIINYGISSRWSGHFSGLEDDNPIRMKWEKERSEDFTKIQHYLASRYLQQIEDSEVGE